VQVGGSVPGWVQVLGVSLSMSGCLLVFQGGSIPG